MKGNHKKLIYGIGYEHYIILNNQYEKIGCGISFVFNMPGYGQENSDPFTHTFSIVARDSVTGEMGVAVQSHFFSVGSVVPWAEARVGAVANREGRQLAIVAYYS